MSPLLSSLHIPVLHNISLVMAPTLGSNDFGTLTHFKLICIAKKILRSNYKIRFSVFLAIPGENGVFGPKKCELPK
jgi:hypothetical protein